MRKKDINTSNSIESTANSNSIDKKDAGIKFVQYHNGERIESPIELLSGFGNPFPFRFKDETEVTEK